MRNRDNSCPTAFNDVCDENSGRCAPLTDTVDCLGRDTPAGASDHHFGSDDRELVDIGSFPWSAIGQVTIRHGKPCTATLIGPDLLITAAHCLFNADGYLAAPEAVFLGQNGGHYTARGTIRRYYVSPDYRYWEPPRSLGAGNGDDWAFIQINEALGDQYGHMTLLTLDDAKRAQLITATDLTIRQAGYSHDTGNRLSGHVGCRILEFLSDDTFLHECDTTLGDSGSPLFVLRGNTADIVGIDGTDIEVDESDRTGIIAVAASALEQPLQDFINGAGIVADEQPGGYDSCGLANNLECDELQFGGNGYCFAGTDYSDCRALSVGGDDSCQWAFDEVCDELHIGMGLCYPGTDTTDCAAVAHLRNRDNSCPTAFDGVCDENGGHCAPLTDTADCLGRDDVTDGYFGTDDRELVGVRDFPWRTIGQVYSRAFACTATLIGPDLLITAAHCLFDSHGRPIAPEYFLLGNNGDDYTARGTIRRYYISPDYIFPDYDPHFRYTDTTTTEAQLRVDNGDDWAFIQINEALGDQYGHMTLLPLDEAWQAQLIAATDLTIRQAGYSWDTGNHLSGHVGCRILEFRPDDTFLHECDTTFGDSGSPLFVLLGDTAAIVGIEAAFFPGLLDVSVGYIRGRDGFRKLAVAASAVEQPLQDFINGAGISVEPGAASNEGAGE